MSKKKNRKRIKRKTTRPVKIDPVQPPHLHAFGEAVELDVDVTYDTPDGLTVGRPFKTLAIGQVSSRMSGDPIGDPVDMDLLTELVRVFNERSSEDPVIIDWNHATSPFQEGDLASPETGSALGLIVGLDLREDGLYAVPAYNERGLDVVSRAGGVLWSSPEYLQGEIFSRAGGAKIGNAQLLAITLTPRPAQDHSTIDRITLSEERYMDDLNEMSVEDLRSLVAAKDAMIKELEDRLNEMTSDTEAALTEPDQEETQDEELTEEAPQLKAEDDEEEEDETKLSEVSTAPSMLSEIQALRESNKKLNTRLKKIEQEKHNVERSSAVNLLLREGRIAPKEKSTASQAYDARNTHPDFWKMFSERSVNEAVPMHEIGHGASAAELDKAGLDEIIKSNAAAKSITYFQALNEYRVSDPETYNRVFGVKR